MDLSLGEFRALVAKAFRGAGYPWGLTEDAAHAAATLASYGIDAGLLVVRLLSHTDQRTVEQHMPDALWAAPSGVLCPVCVGAAIADVGRLDALALGRVFQPVLLSPFLMELVDEENPAFVIDWQEGRCIVGEDRIVVDGSSPIGPTETSITPGTTTNSTGQSPVKTPPVRLTRVDLDQRTQARIEDFAGRVYAPATEASRRSGAGAQLGDND